MRTFRPNAFLRPVTTGLLVVLVAGACGMTVDPTRSTYGSAVSAPPRTIDGSGGSATSQVERVKTRAQRIILPQREISSIDLQWPVGSAGQVTSPYGFRTDPISGKRRFHHGVDIGCWTGQRIEAAATGRVIFAAPARWYGNAVVIAHSPSVWTLYAHLDRIAVDVGERVLVGNGIGRCGSTGRSTGSHLHLELRWGNTVIDPVAYLS